MTMDQPSSSGFGDFGGTYSSDPFTSTSPPTRSDPDVDWSVFENAGMNHPKFNKSSFFFLSIF